ncbi:CAP domain-containing protein [Nocardioides ferulae]|uniref:CAP domain-containing protein n=1 Tax=Nocardioides ferulae TaxID=2340821 RepID=UPI0013DE4E26|nr:CAP domain-containing protein [Nocardioides ferulae]
MASLPRTAAGVGALLLPLLSVAPGPAHARQAPDAAQGGARDYASGAVRATNQQRADHDLVRLDPGRCLQRKAAQQARKMARRGEIFHQDLQPVLEDCGLTSTGENVASGFPTGRATVNRGWMRSAGHRANILEADYRLMGLAARKSQGRWYVAQVFGAR